MEGVGRMGERGNKLRFYNALGNKKLFAVV
jgi:hypothetical protein